MFDLPHAKRIRRDEVISPSSSRESSPVDDSDLQDAHDRLGKLLDLEGIFAGDAMNDNKEILPPTTSIENEDDEQEFEFRLFSAPTKSTDTMAPAGQPSCETPSAIEVALAKDTRVTSGTQKLRIRLRSPTPGSSEGRFVKAFRGWQYYFSSPSLYGIKCDQTEEDRQLERRRQFEETAVTGQHIMTWAKSQPWPGCHLPWRVIHLKRHQTKLPPKSKDVPVYVMEGAPLTKSPKTRKKPGKKRRIQLRKKAAMIEAAKETEAEKRNRKNRERKAKRRQKAREEKAAAAVAAAAGGDVPMMDANSSERGH